MKKILLGMGTLATVIAPVTTVVACDDDKDTNTTTPPARTTGPVEWNHHPLPAGENQKQGQTGTAPKAFTAFPTDGLHILSQELRLNSLNQKQRTEKLSIWHTDIKQPILDIAKNMRDTMNANPDWQWHTYGDPFVDGANAIRLAIHNDLNGDNTMKHQLRDFIAGALPKYYNNTETGYYKIYSKKQINDWLNDKKDLEIASMYDWKAIMAATDLPSIEAACSTNKEALTKDYRALTLSTNMLYKSEHRVQECDWLGEFDNHGFGDTIKKIEAGAKTDNGHPTGEFADAPNWENAPGYAGEDYMFPYTYNAHTFEEGTDFVSGLLTAINILYDSDDAHHSTGHRTNYFSKDLSTLGWSRTASNYGGYNWNNFQYVLTEAANERRLDPSIGRSDEIKKANPFLNKYSMEMLEYMSPMEYFNMINTNSKYLGYRNFPFAKRTYGDRVTAEFFKPHASFKEFETAIRVAQRQGGFEDMTQLEEPTSMPEFSRLAYPQEIGRPDTPIKTYDYDGGGIITGAQYGYSPIDDSLFEPSGYKAPTA